MMNDIEQTTSQETDRWLQERQRSGNWFDIAETDEIPADIDGWLRTILHLFQIAFAPEIKKRLASGQLDDKFTLYAVQWIQPIEGRGMVRLNEEVRAIGLVRATRAIKEGDPVFLSDLQHLQSVDLEEDELDAGHFTLFWNGKGWVGSFDLRAGRAISARLLGNAVEFLRTAQYARDQGHARACVDNLFSACELASKTRLILHHSPAAKAKKHGPIHSAINKWGHLGNVDEAFLRLFNRLSNSRSAARYDLGVQVEMPSGSDLQIATREIEQLQEPIAQRTKTVDVE